MFNGKLLSGTSIYLKDVLHPPEVPDCDLDGWVIFTEPDVDVDADAEVMLSWGGVK